jgi:cyclopropane fatty-acyl-phospholipid synthase-like methyltransferase
VIAVAASSLGVLELPDTGASVVAGLPFGDPASMEREFSIRLLPGRLERWGRFGTWMTGASPDAFAPAARWLREVEAPPEVIAAQAACITPVRQGVAVALTANGPEFRLYLHGRRGDTQGDDYRALRWRHGQTPRRSSYVFHFLPETPDGQTPADLVPEWARAAFAGLAADPWMRRASGFWLRRDADGRLDQIDLTFPWHPPAGMLAGLMKLAEDFGIPEDERAWLAGLPVRHVAVKAAEAAQTGDEPAVTLYVSGPAAVEAPATEAELQAQTCQGALAVSQKARLFHALLPNLPAAEPDRPALDEFYSGAIERWHAVLGDEMHYHHALFTAPDANPDDATMHAASRRAVSDLFDFIAPGERVYDVGCGWGGPLAMLARERQCQVLGVTIAREQFRHIAAMQLPVRWADAERTLPPGRFDCILLLESFEHIVEKKRLLTLLRPFGGRLVMRVNCQDSAPPRSRFGGTMQMISSPMLRELLDQTGWRVRHWRDRRREAMPSATAWLRRLRRLGPTDDKHLETMRGWCERVVRFGETWGGHNPLIEVVAE